MRPQVFLIESDGFTKTFKTFDLGATVRTLFPEFGKVSWTQINSNETIFWGKVKATQLSRIPLSWVKWTPIKINQIQFPS